LLPKPQAVWARTVEAVARATNNAEVLTILCVFPKGKRMYGKSDYDSLLEQSQKSTEVYREEGVMSE
jgi:hypothetical protein